MYFMYVILLQFINCYPYKFHCICFALSHNHKIIKTTFSIRGLEQNCLFLPCLQSIFYGLYSLEDQLLSVFTFLFKFPLGWTLANWRLHVFHHGFIILITESAKTDSIIYCNINCFNTPFWLSCYSENFFFKSSLVLEGHNGHPISLPLF